LLLPPLLVAVLLRTAVAILLLSLLQNQKRKGVG